MSSLSLPPMRVLVGTGKAREGSLARYACPKALYVFVLASSASARRLGAKWPQPQPVIKFLQLPVPGWQSMGWRCVASSEVRRFMRSLCLHQPGLASLSLSLSWILHLWQLALSVPQIMAQVMAQVMAQAVFAPPAAPGTAFKMWAMREAER